MQPLRRWPPPGMHLHWGSCGRLTGGLLRSLFWKWYPSHRKQADAHGLTADDFEQEGFFAVKYAAETYDPDKGFAFTIWLASAMQRQIGRVMSSCTILWKKQWRN